MFQYHIFFSNIESRMKFIWNGFKAGKTKRKVRSGRKFRQVETKPDYLKPTTNPAKRLIWFAIWKSLSRLSSSICSIQILHIQRFLKCQCQGNVPPACVCFGRHFIGREILLVKPLLSEPVKIFFTLHTQLEDIRWQKLNWIFVLHSGISPYQNPVHGSFV